MKIFSKKSSTGIPNMLRNSSENSASVDIRFRVLVRIFARKVFRNENVKKLGKPFFWQNDVHHYSFLIRHNLIFLLFNLTIIPFCSELNSTPGGIRSTVS